MRWCVAIARELYSTSSVATLLVWSTVSTVITCIAHVRACMCMYTCNYCMHMECRSVSECQSISLQLQEDCVNTICMWKLWCWQVVRELYDYCKMTVWVSECCGINRYVHNSLAKWIYFNFAVLTVARELCKWMCWQLLCDCKRVVWLLNVCESCGVNSCKRVVWTLYACGISRYFTVFRGVNSVLEVARRLYESELRVSASVLDVARKLINNMPMVLL